MLIYNKIVILILFIHSFVTKCSTQYFNNIVIHIEKDHKLYELLEQGSILLEKNVTTVLIEDQEVPILKKSSFKNLPRLKGIYLLNDGIHSFENGCFKNLPELRIMKIHFNKIDELKETIFHNLSITKLSLIGNGLKIIRENTFKTLTQLEELDLSANALRALPRTLLQDTKYLEKINLSKNKITHIPDGFFYEAFIYRQFGQETTIDLSNNKLTSFTEKTFDGVRYIENLILSDNLIKYLGSKIFNNIRYIKLIDLQRNLLEGISEELLATFFKKPDQILLSGNNFTVKYVTRLKRWQEKVRTVKLVQFDWDAYLNEC